LDRANWIEVPVNRDKYRWQGQKCKVFASSRATVKVFRTIRDTSAPDPGPGSEKRANGDLWKGRGETGTARRVGIIAHLVGRASENNVENCFAVFLSRFQGHTGLGALTGALSVFHQSRGPFHRARISSLPVFACGASRSIAIAANY